MIQYYPIKMLKMVTGEQVITGIADGGTNNYIFERPMAIVVVPVKKWKNLRNPNAGDSVEGMNVILKDWIDFTTDDYITVPKSNVVAIITPLRDLVADYQMAKINADMDREIDNAPDALSDPDEEGEETDEDDGVDPEFPGWGGNPKFDR
jgi:hypothetical protein